MAARICRKNHDIRQTQQVIPPISRETPFSSDVSKLFFGVNMFDLDFGYKVGGALAIRLITGSDFAETRSSPESCCNLFVIASEQTVDL